MTIRECSKYRNIWMAFAIICIIIYHAYFTMNSFPLNVIKEYGYGGVDIFFFASGYGCYFSYEKNPSALAFYKKRWLRLMPCYFVLIIPWAIIKLLKGELGIQACLGNVLGIQSLIGEGAFNWYLGAIIILYLMTPLFFELLKKNNKIITYVIMIFTMLLISYVTWDAPGLVVISTRLPIYFIGMVCAKHADFKIDIKWYIISLVLMIIGWLMLVFFTQNYLDVMWYHGLFWYPFILITPGLCFTLSFICRASSKVKGGRIILKPFSFIGTYTWELFLVHELIFERMPEPDMFKEYIMTLPKYEGALICMIVIVLGAALLHIITELIRKIFRRESRQLHKCSL